MILHDLKFFIRQSFWFIQYFFRDIDFTDIMK